MVTNPLFSPSNPCDSKGSTLLLHLLPFITVFYSYSLMKPFCRMPCSVSFYGLGFPIHIVLSTNRFFKTFLTQLVFDMVLSTPFVIGFQKLAFPGPVQKILCCIQRKNRLMGHYIQQSIFFCLVRSFNLVLHRSLFGGS